MKIKSSKIIFSTLAVVFLCLSSTCCFAENSVRQAQIDESMAKSKIDQLRKKQVREIKVDGVDSIDARKTQVQILEQEQKLAEAEEQLDEAVAENDNE